MRVTAAGNEKGKYDCGPTLLTMAGNFNWQSFHSFSTSKRHISIEVLAICSVFVQFNGWEDPCKVI